MKKYFCIQKKLTNLSFVLILLLYTNAMYSQENAQDCSSLPMIMVFDQHLDYNSPSHNSVDENLIFCPNIFHWNKGGHLQAKIDGNITIKNTGIRKYQDIFIDAVITVLDENKKIVRTLIIPWHKTDTDKDMEYTWTFIRNADIPPNGYIKVELICKRVTSFDPGGTPLVNGSFDIVNNSIIKIEKL